MKTFSRASILLLLLVGVQSKAFGQEPPRVTSNQLLRAPQEFNHKEVLVTGYFVYDAMKGASLFANSREADHNGASIGVDQIVFFNPGMTTTQSNAAPPNVGISDSCELKDCYVKLIGTFCCKGGACELNRIVLFRRIKRSEKTDSHPCAMYPGKS